MPDTRQYTPVFKGELPSDTESRWEAIRRFISRWCRPADSPLPETYNGNSKLIDNANAISDGAVSYSIGQWLALVENSAILDSPHIRDCPVIQPIEEFFKDGKIGNATVILESGEGDVYWAVENDRLRDDDPPVHIYQKYDPSSPALVGRNGSVSEFALKYVCLYNEHSVGNTEWFSADGTEDDVRNVVDWFDYALAFDSDDGLFSHFELLESNNIAAFVNGTRIEVSLFCDPAMLDMPQLLTTQMKEHIKLRERFKSSRPFE